jgi:hypothetical protein
MTTKADFSEEEWKQVLEGPPAAGLLVITAEHGGSFRETLSMAKVYAEARQHHGQSELLDEIAAAKPAIDHTRYHSPDELKQGTLGHIRDGVALVAAKGEPQELAEYKAFIVNLAETVARAHKEHRGDDAVGAGERDAITAIKEASS